MKETLTKRFKSRFGIPAGEEIKRILIARTCRMEAFKEIVVDVQTDFPGCKLYCITNAETASIVKDMKNFVEVFTYETTPFKLRDFDSNVKNNMKRIKFDLCVLPYNNNNGAGYADWRLFLMQMGAKYCFCCDGRIGSIYARKFRGGNRFGYLTEVEYAAKDALETVVAASLFGTFAGLVGVGLVLKGVLKPIEPQIEKIYWKIVR